STFLIDTGLLLIPNTHALSHGAVTEYKTNGTTVETQYKQPSPSARQRRNDLENGYIPGQTFPVNSGKLLVDISLFSASRQRLWKTRSFQSGIRLLMGQPVPLWQKGTPQSMQRAACVRTSSTLGRRLISPQSSMRSDTGRNGTLARLYCMKPVVLSRVA